MTDQEKAIVMAYTGTCMLAGDKLGIYYQYVQEKLGHCVMTHELVFPEVQDAIKEAAKDDFVALCKKSDGPKVMTLAEALAADYVYLEIKLHASLPCDCCILAIDPDGGILPLKKGFAGYLDGEEYGKTWRCWTSRPTEEQRRETPWTT